MQAVILAGGLGTRLRPLTERIPKPMVEVGGRPFLEYLVRHLAGQGFSRLLMLVGYLGQRVQDHFGDGAGLGIDIDYAWEEKPLGTGGAVRQALQRLEKRFLLLYGDSYLPIDYRPVADAFGQSSCLGMVVVYDNRFSDTGVLNNVATDDEGWVVRYEKGRGGEDLKYVEAGVLCLDRDVFAGLPRECAISLEQEVYPALIARRQLRGFVTRQRFFDIGTPARLTEFAATLA